MLHNNQILQKLHRIWAWNDVYVVKEQKSGIKGWQIRKKRREKVQRRDRESSPSKEDNVDGLRQCCLSKYDVAEMVGSGTKKKKKKTVEFN